MEKPMQLQFSAIVRRDDPIVSDHRIHGVRIMPGVCFFDMIYRFLKAKEVDPCSARLENILFLEPVTATEDFDCNVHVAIEGREGRLTALAKSRPRGSGASPGEWRENLRCEIRLDAPQWKGRLPVDRLQREARRQIGLEEAYRLTARMDILHGPFMKAEGRVFEGSDYFLAEVRLNGPAEAAAADFFLHPVHLDAATAVLALLHPKGAESVSRPAIPFHIESFQAVAPLQGTCFVYVKKVKEAAASGDVLYSNVEIYSPEGVGLVRFQRFAAKRIRERGFMTRLERGREVHAGDAAPRPEANSAPAPRVQRERASSRDMETYLREVVAREIHKPPEETSVEAGFYSLGLDSVGLLNIVRRMEEDLGRPLYPTLLFEYQCIHDLAGYLSNLPDAPAAPAIPAGRDEGPEENALRPELLYFTPVWREVPACGKHDGRKTEAVASGETGRPSLLALGMDRGVFDALKSRTDSPFHGRMALALPEDAFLRRDPGVFEFNPAVETDYVRLLDELEKEGGLPGAIIHALPAD
ncbi:MAG: polyketide synthase dehydratase domain-containing protein, partial [Syntrophobacteraceae bacterium]